MIQKESNQRIDERSEVATRLIPPSNRSRGETFALNSDVAPNEASYLYLWDYHISIRLTFGLTRGEQNSTKSRTRLKAELH